MTTPKITYAHLLTEPNPKHVESLIKFFESGCQQRGTGGFGVEIEHLPVHNSDDTAVTYYESNGIEALLNRIRPYYDENKEYWENGRLVGLARDGISVSLEPGGQYNVPHGLANAILLPLVLREYGSCIDKKLHRLAIAAGLADKNTPDHEAAELFIRAIEEMKERFGIVNIVKEIQETDIPKLAHYADKEANPLYPVPKLMDASELEKFYYMLMSLTSKENTSEAEK